MAKPAKTPSDPTDSSVTRSQSPLRLEESSLLAGPPLTTRELAKMIGMSATFIREEIHGGHLHAVVVGRGRKRVYRIPAREAYRYIKDLGIL